MTAGQGRDFGRGFVVDVAVVSEAVAGLLAAGGVKELGEAAGGGLVAGIVSRVRKVFGSDARSVDALGRARQGEPGAVAELASALAWYARQNQAFAEELAGWASRAGQSGGVTQQVRAGRDAYTAGRDQTVTNYRRPGELARRSLVPGDREPSRDPQVWQAVSAGQSAYTAGVNQVVVNFPARRGTGGGRPAEGCRGRVDPQPRVQRPGGLLGLVRGRCRHCGEWAGRQDAAGGRVRAPLRDRLRHHLVGRRGTAGVDRRARVEVAERGGWVCGTVMRRPCADGFSVYRTMTGAVLLK